MNFEELEKRISKLEEVQKEGISVLKGWVALLLTLIVVSFFV
jgi:hypothetical protein